MKITNTFIKTMLLSSMMVGGQLHAAPPINPEAQPLGYIGPIELTTSDLSNGARAYRGWFENGSWQGDLIEYDVSSKGLLTTSIDLTTINPQQSVGGTNWSAHVQFKANAGGISHWDTGRKIITNANGSQVPFRWSSLNPTQKAALDQGAFDGGLATSKVLNFLRGDRSNENPTGNLRLRYSVLGDIVHSNPEYVGAPEGDSTDPDYITFKANKANRSPRVYVGANDGMLHAFDATNGNEVWAYVPSMLIPKMGFLAGVPYEHKYYVDGSITILDAQIGGNWRSVLVGSLGAGGKGLYVLDVTDPDLSSEVTGDKKVMFEVDPASNNDVGYIFDQATIAKLDNGKWYAFIGNGVGSASNVAKLLIIDLETGNVKAIAAGTGTAASPNGLAAPALVDKNNDGFVDIAYAGDLNGDMWKFNLNGTPSVEYKLFDGVETQPITTAPDVTLHPDGGYMVLFGTGKLYEDADINDASVQALYGVWDTLSTPTIAPNLAQLLSGNETYITGGANEEVRTFTTVADVDYKTYRGWQVDLPAGERLLTPPQLRAGRLKTTVTNPSNYNNWLLEVTFEHGTADTESIYDLNRDGLLNTLDRVDSNGNSLLNDQEDIPMAWRRPTGTMSQVTIASLSSGVDTLFLNFLNPPLVPPGCEGVCSGGLSGGHMDVDTDATLGDETDSHVHEYDDDTERTYVDYFDIDPTNAGKPIPVDSVGIPNDKEFIVLMTNADWSPGGELTLDTDVYSVVEYQRIIHMALRTWDGNPKTLKYKGKSLVFTLDQIRADGGTLKSTFNSTAIVAGGLIGTNTGCVNKSTALTKGRWRNGSLVFQLVEADHFRNWKSRGFANALDLVQVLTPDDLKPTVQLRNSQVKLVEDLSGDGLINAASPDYEVMGGLVAKDNSEFLYESTLFWHWDGDCYGTANWEDEFVTATQGIPAEIYEELLTDAGFETIAQLVAEIESLTDCKDKSISKGGCKEDFEALQELYEMGLLVENANGGGTGTPTGTGSGLSGDPVVMEGGVSESGITSGPNFKTGRRTWIDILPE